MENKCPYCDYTTPEPLDGDAGVRGWQEVAHMNLHHKDVIRKRFEEAMFPFPDDIARFGGRREMKKNP